MPDPNKCTATFKRAQRKAHEQNCDYAPAKCNHYDKGCPFFGKIYPRNAPNWDWKGPKIRVKEHLLECVYEKLKHYISRNDEQFENLKQTVRVCKIANFAIIAI